MLIAISVGLMIRIRVNNKPSMVWNSYCLASPRGIETRFAGISEWVEPETRPAVMPN